MEQLLLEMAQHYILPTLYVQLLSETDFYDHCSATSCCLNHERKQHKQKKQKQKRVDVFFFHPEICDMQAGYANLFTECCTYIVEGICFHFLTVRPHPQVYRSIFKM